MGQKRFYSCFSVLSEVITNLCFPYEEQLNKSFFMVIWCLCMFLFENCHVTQMPG